VILTALFDQHALREVRERAMPKIVRQGRDVRVGRPGLNRGAPGEGAGDGDLHRTMSNLPSELKLGNLDAKRDWGHAANYVEAMWRMLQQDEPDDYVVATAETHSVREFARLAFQYAGLDYETYIVTDSQLYRPAEVDLLVGNPAKAHGRLGWMSSTTLQSMVWEMVESDCRALGIELDKGNLTVPMSRSGTA